LCAYFISKCKEFENSVLRTLRILRGNFSRFRGPSENDMEREGASTRGCGNNWWRSQEKTSKESIRVVVVEKDMTVHLNSIGTTI
jgi:hypothetical protein